MAEREVFPSVFPQFETKTVADDSYWRKHGVDYILKSKAGGDRVLIEIKADRKTTGNIVAEDYTKVLADNSIKYQWLHFSKADIILYFVMHTRTFFMLDVPKLRYLIADGSFVRKSTVQKWGITYFYLLPIEQLKSQFKYVTVDEATWNSWQAPAPVLQGVAP